MGAKSWQYIGAGISVPLMGWALSDIAHGNVYVSYVALPFAIGLGAVCLIGIVLAHRKASRQRDGLAVLISEADALMNRMATVGEIFPQSEVEAWWGKVQTFVKKELSGAHMVRLNSDPTPTAVLTSSAISDESKNYWAWMNRRNIRLHEFIREAAQRS